MTWGHLFRYVGLLLAAGAMTGCSTLAYYSQAAGGHLALMAAARPVAEVRSDPATPPELARRLERAQEIRRFASQALGLPDNASYTRYAQLGRPFAVWNVIAAPEFSFELKTWCYPVAGCAAYRGYYDSAAAQREAAALRAEGWDVNVAGVAAYSTLGWFADPLLDTFVLRPESQLAALVFHELAHQVLYVPDDTGFNEAFATAVETEGVARWLAAHGSAAERLAWAQFSQRREQFVGLLRQARVELDLLYGLPLPAAAMRERKAAVLVQLRADYEKLKAQWGGWPGYDRFFEADLGNAHLAAVGAYFDAVPAFAALLAAQQGELPRFYAAAAELARLPPELRRMKLAGGSPLPR